MDARYGGPAIQKADTKKCIRLKYEGFKRRLLLAINHSRCQVNDEILLVGDFH